MKSYFFFLLVCYPDTWVATDASGRMMPDFSDVGPVKTDQRRVVGINGAITQVN